MDNGGSAAHRKRRKLVLTLFFFFSGILTATWSSRIPDVQQKLALNNAELGSILSAIPVGLIIGISMAGWLVASFGAKKVMVWFCVFCAAMLTFAGLSNNNIALVVSLFFLGMGRTIFNLAANTGSIEIQKEYNKPIVAAFHGIWSLACFVAGGIGTLMIVLNISVQFHFAGIALLITALAIFSEAEEQLYKVMWRSDLFS